MKRYQLKLKLQEPMTIGVHRMIGNQSPSLDFIPATALRGALAAGLARQGRTARLAPLFGGCSPRWCPAWPYDRETDAVVVPMPLSFLRAKGDEGFEGALGVINVLQATRPTDAPQYEKLFGTKPPGSIDLFQWVAMPSAWLKILMSSNRKTIYDPAAVAPMMGDAMFHGADYMTGAAWKGMLFSRGAVTEGQTFVSYVIDEKDVIENEDRLPESFLGKRLTAGNGHIVIEWLDITDPPPWATQAGDDAEDVTVQIMSPAIVPGKKGGFLAGIDEAAWQDLLGVEIDLKSAQSEASAVQGWITAWNLPREAYPAIAAGSCFRLRLKKSSEKAKFHGKLKILVEKGLGIRTGEGFGWIAVSPPWLNNAYFEGNNSANGPFKPRGNPPVTGGNIIPAEKRELIRKAYSFAGDQSVRKKAAEIAAMADRVNSVFDFEAYLDGLSKRTNPRKWDDVQKRWQDVGKSIVYNDEERMRFFLSWTKIFGEA